MAWADRSPVEQAALRYCAPHGIPLSVFLEQRVVYPGDPMWLEDDTVAALEWQAEQDRKCPDCGQPIDESTKLENHAAYKATGLRCHACYAVDREAARLAEGKPSKTAGFRYQVTKKEAS